LSLFFFFKSLSFSLSDFYEPLVAGALLSLVPLLLALALSRAFSGPDRPRERASAGKKLGNASKEKKKKKKK
jgi:hypothetical protein